MNTLIVAGACIVSSCPPVATVDTLPPVPIAISNNAVAAVDHGDGTYTLYSFMGITVPTSFSSITDASFRYDGPGGTWTSIADAPRLNDRAKIGSNAIAVAGEVYLIGGYTVGGGPEMTDPRLFRYDPDLDEYEERAEVPTEVDDTVTGVYQDRYLYLISGWHGPIFSNVPNVQVYDTQTNTWTQATPIPAPLPGLFGHAGGIVGDRIVYMDGARIGAAFPISDRVFVGQIDPDGTGDVTNIVWQEQPAHPGAPTYRAAPGAMSAGGSLFVAGGTDNTYNFSGTGYDGNPSLPLAQMLEWTPADGFRLLTLAGDHVPTMDHRGLLGLPDGSWVTVGGMTAPGTTTDRVQRYSIGRAAAGDVDCDGIVDFLDLLTVLASWGPCPACPADLDGDGFVGFLDLLTVLSGWT
ncbi:MAG: hypothetical protein HKN62_11040 [Phycisphaerales bacterium]|nr:hypothetical protein [Phycisphaerales bacterium]